MPERARKLARLVEQTGLIEAVRADLYLRWCNSRDMDDWSEVLVAHTLLDRAEQILKDMTDDS